jgi:hypothetical protein
MQLDAVLKNIKQTYMTRKKVDFEDANLHFELEPITADEEIKIMAYCKDYQGSEYIDALKRSSLACTIKKINDNDLSVVDVSYIEENKPITKTKFLFMLDYIGKWPTSFIDILFTAYYEMQQEIEAKVNGSAKFERFQLAEKPQESVIKPKFREVKETDEGLDAEERLRKTVEKEIETENSKMASTADAAVFKATTKK